MRSFRVVGVFLLCALALRANVTAQAVSGLKSVRVASGLSSPIYVVAPPGDYDRLFIVQQGGAVRILRLETGTVDETPFLSLSGLPNGGEQGLLGLAFDPDYSSNGKLYVYYTAAGGEFNAGISRVSQFTVSADPDEVDPLSEKILLAFDQPFTNHNGGWIDFSPRPNDRHNLYIASGDGGSGNDPGNNGQNPVTLLGKMLRIKVDPAAGSYSIPDNNPYAASTGPEAKEVFSLGLRNPYRCGFDRATGELFIGDVGQSAREEVSVQKASNPGGGENFGWRLREGLIATPDVGGNRPAGNVDPIHDYERTIGRTIIGGYAYRGRQIPALRGVYVFGDYLGPEGAPAAPKIFTLNYNGAVATNVQDITAQLSPSAGGQALNLLSSFGEDANGELYFTDIGDGEVFRIMPINPNVEIAAITKEAGGNVVVEGFGVPFAMHTLEATDTLVEEFEPAQSATASGSGAVQFTDTSPGGTARFYRIVLP